MRAGFESLQDLYAFHILKNAQGLAKLQVFASHPEHPDIKTKTALSRFCFSYLFTSK